MTTRTIERPEAKRSTTHRPARAWRNKFRLRRSGRDTSGNTYRRGVVWGNLVFASKDLAETHATKIITTERYWIERGIKYVGAFPVEAP